MKKKLLALLLVIMVIFTVSLVACNPTEAAIDHIEITAKPITSYVRGQALDLNGAQITVFYDGGKQEVVDVNASMISNFNPYLLGTQILNISFKGSSTSLEVFVAKAEIENVELLKLPNKLTFIVEQNLDTTGGQLKISYADGEVEFVDITENMCSEYNMQKVATQSVKVTYMGAQKTYEIRYDIVVSDKTLQGIEINKLPTKNIYYIGDELDLTGGRLFAKYDNGYPVYLEMKDLVGLEYSWDSITENNNSEVTLTYGGKSVKFNVAVKVRDILEFKVLSQPSHTQLVGTDLDLSGLKIEVTYNNYTTEVITFPTDRVKTPSYDSSKVGAQTVELVFYFATVELKTRYSIEVVLDDKIMSDIQIIRPEGDKLYQDTTINPFNTWQYIIVYNNGQKSEPAYLLPNMIMNPPTEGLIYHTPGTYSWQIRYMSLEVEYTFEVLALEVESMEVIGDRQAKVYYNHKIDTTGFFVRVKYNNGTYKIVNGSDKIPLTASMVSDYDNLVLGAQTATITYTDEYESGFSIDFPVLVVKKVSTSLGMEHAPNKVSYTTAEGFDYSGLVINLSYEGESQSQKITEFNADWTFSNSEWDPITKKFDTVGKKNIYLTYAGLEHPDTQGINIEIYVHNNFTSITLINADLGVVIVGGNLDFSGISFKLSYEVGNTTISYDKNNNRFVYYDQASGEAAPLKGELSFDYNNKNLEIGNRIVTVTYTEGDSTETCKTVVSVVDKSEASIEIFKLPIKLEYILDKNDESLDLSGIIVNLIYNNGTKRVLASSEYTNNSHDSSIEGEQDIRISYKSFTAIFTITVKKAVAKSISWAGAAPNIFIQEGVDFDLVATGVAEFTVNIILSDGTAQTVTIADIMEDITVINYDKFSPGSQTPEIIYSGLSLPIAVTVNKRILTSITIAADSSPLSAIEASPIDLTNAKILLSFDNGSTTTVIPMKQDYIVKSAQNPGGYDIANVTPGVREVTISYTHNGQTCTVVTTMTVSSKRMTGIGMKNMPKIKYIEGEKLDAAALANGSVILYYNNGTTEEKKLSEATINNAASSFNINAVRFDSSEFSGFSKLQTIYVTYRTQSQEVFKTEFDILMHDRKKALVEFSSSNILNFIYGEINSSNAPKFEVKGYNTFDSTVRELIFSKDKILVEYVRAEDIFEDRIPGKDYTILPTAAGQYVMVISYNAQDYEDMIHNSFVNMDTRITISTKKIFVEIDNVSKIYGTGNPNYYIKAYGADFNGAMSRDIPPFALGDSFVSLGFAGANPGITNTVCYDENGNEISLFNIVIKSANGTVVDVTNKTSVSTYSLTLGGFASTNYNIVYLNSAYDVVKRKVKVTPSDISVEYGVTSQTIPYTTAAIEGDPDSGLCNEDILRGNPIKAFGDNAGRYSITVGSLTHANYQIIFDDSKFVTIEKRNIYVKVVSTSRVYGDNNAPFAVEYFRDATCLDKNAFAFSADVPSGLGILTFDYGNIDYKTNIGSYAIKANITPYPDGQKPSDIVDIGNNYNINYIDGIITITARPVLVKADEQSKVFGEQDPILTYTAEKANGTTSTGLILLDDIWDEYEKLKGELTRTPGDFVGKYSISMGSLQKENKNYNITYVGAFFTVAEVVLVVKLDRAVLQKEYDGRLPAISKESYQIFKVVNGEEIAVDNASFDFSIINIEFQNPSRNFGTYNVSVVSNDSNYAVSFPKNVTYVYQIDTIIVDIEYLNLPNNLEYKKEAYTFSAKVLDSMVQKEYNSDGSVKTDENNNEIKDIVNVVLSSSSATDAGNYEVSAIRISSANQNYELSEAAKRPVTFTIKQRALVVEVNTNSKDGLTLERDYTDQNAFLQPKDFTVLNKIPNVDIPVSLRVLDSDITNEAAPKNVRYAADGVTVIGYDIITVALADKNYTLTLKEEYKYKIMPKTAEVTITQSFLEKIYDGKVPQVASGVIINVTTLPASALNYKFTRTTADGRSNADVGTYSVIVTSADRNHKVVLTKAYEYVIKPATVSVTLSNQFNKKEYDGNPISLPRNAISYTNTPGLQPILRTFINDTLYFGFTAGMTKLLAMYSSLNTAINLIEFTGNDYSTILCNNALSALVNFNKSYDDIAALLNSNNSGILDKEISKIENELNGILELLKDEGYDKAVAENAAARIRASRDTILFTVNTENTYLAFIFSGNESGSAVGEYTYRMEYSDDNKEYKLLNITKTYTITQKNVAVKITGLVDGAESIYGSPLATLGYEFYPDRSFVGAPLTGLDLVGTVEILFNNATLEFQPAGTYEVRPSAGILGNANYKVDYVTVEYTIAPKEVAIKISDEIGMNADAPIVYGTKITGMELRNWALEDPRSLVGTDTIDLFSTKDAVYTCYMPDGHTLITAPAAQPQVGKYDVNIEQEHGFTASNYVFRYITGTLTVQKKALTIIEANNLISRIYGEAPILNYTGFVYNEKQSDFTIINPTPNRELFDGDAGFNPETDVTEKTYKVAFTIGADSENQFANYYISLSEYYNLRIAPAELEFRLTGTGNGNSLVAEYGSNPEYNAAITGFKNNDKQEFDAQFDVQGSKFANIATFNFKKDVKDNSRPFGLGINDIVFKEEFADYLVNYICTIEEVGYTVTQKEITVGLNKDIAVMYDTSNRVKVEPYIMHSTGTEEKPVNTLIRGQYGPQNIVFAGFAYGETAEAVFKKRTGSDSFTEGSGETLRTLTYIAHSDFYEHTLVHPQDVGESTIALSAMKFIISDNIQDANYKVKYLTSKLTVYSKIVNLEAASDSILLEGEANLDNLDIYAATEANTKDNYKLGDSGGKITYSGTVSGVDINNLITVTYNATYNLSGFSLENDLGSSYSSLNLVTKDYDASRVVKNKEITTKVPVRVYSKETISVNNGITITGGEKLDATQTIQNRVSSAGVGNFDVIKTAVRFDTQITREKAFSYELIINGVSINNKITLLAMGGYDATTKQSIYTLAIAQYRNGNIVQLNNIDISGINLFDGYTHEIVIYYEKRMNTVYVSIDGVVNSIVSIRFEDTTVGESTEYGYKCTENSLSGFTLSGITMWVQNFDLAKQGYKDTFATLARPAVDNNSEGFFIRYLTSNEGKAVVNIAKVFEPYIIRNARLTYKYYADGVLVLTRTAASSADGDVTLEQGIHELSLVITDGTSEISRTNSRLLVTTAAKNITIYDNANAVIGTIANGKATDLFGFGRIDSDSENLVINDSGRTPYSYALRRPFENTNYKQASISFSVTAATFAGTSFNIDSASYVNLLSNSGATPMKIGIKMPYKYTSSTEGAYSTSVLEVVVGGKTYTTTIGQIDWDDGSIYTAELYMGMAKDASGTDIGECGFRIRVFKNYTTIWDSTITSDTAFDSGSIPTGNLLALNNTQIGYDASITAWNNRFTVYKAEFNGGKALDYDYINTATGAYIQKTRGGNNAINNATLTLANANRATLLSSYNQIKYTFNAGNYSPEIGESAKIEFLFATTSTKANEGRVLMLVYNKTLLGSFLDFVFYDGSAKFKTQRVATTNLADGNEHTISIALNRSATAASGPKEGITAFGNGVSYKYSTAEISIDGMFAKTCWFPYDNNTNYWYNSSNSYSTGDLTAIGGSNFMPRYSFVAIGVNDKLTLQLSKMAAGFRYV